MPRIDLNCDLGEGAGQDAELMPLITSANIACGAHAGDEATMAATLELAKAHGVAVGAHPGFADRENFGRRRVEMMPAAAGSLVQGQVRLLQALGRDRGVRVEFVKLHGALYNLTATDPVLAGAIARAIAETDSGLAVVTLPGSALERAARAVGLRVWGEFFADRSYQPDGSLTPRERPDALIQDEAAAVAQVLGMVRSGRVRATDGTEVAVEAHTVCLHGDGPHAVAFAGRLRSALAEAGVEVGACVRGC